MAPSRTVVGGRPTRAVLIALVALMGSILAGPPAALAGNKSSVGPVVVSSAVHADVSGPARDLQGDAPSASDEEKEHKEKPLRSLPNRGNALNQPDGAVQGAAAAAGPATPGLGFAGVGQGDYGFSDQYAPPDTNGAVGATQYVQWVNTAYAVFNKSTGAIVAGYPKPGNSLWSGFGGGCQSNNDGDPIVQYDKLANRWILTQFSVSTTPYLQCVAVSTSPDATGSYYRYAFSYGTSDFNDYPKLGVWPDGYYVSYNIFTNGQTFAGSKVCALDRAKMLVGDASATQQCVQLGSAFGGLLPSDVDGTTPPPAGSPDYVLNYGSNALNLWKFHVDWATPASSTFTGPASIPVASFSPACNGGGTCIPQPGVSQRLDSLADRLMYRLAYRNFDDHEALVVNHAVTVGSSVGVRWYELRDPNGTPTVFQQGTYAPDATFRWMGSIAMDGAGDIALGYSASSSTVSPSIAYAGRAPSDPAGTLSGETVLKAGSGSQYCPNILFCRSLSRWGDYSAMTVDPLDDCTFWYTNEYEKASGAFNWSTWISSFKFPGCGTAQVLTSISVSPASASVQTGGTRQFAATALDQNGSPMNPQPTFAWSVSGGGTISSSGLFTAGSTAGGPFTVGASSGGINGTASVTVTAPAPDFALSATPTTQSIRQGTAATYTVTVAPLNGFAGSVTFSMTGLPSGATATFTPNPATTSSTLRVQTVNGTKGTFHPTITGTSGGLQHTTSVTLQVTKR